MTQEEKKAAKKFLSSASTYICQGYRHKKNAKNAKTEKEAKKWNEWAENKFKQAKNYIARTKEKQNMSYNEEEVYKFLKKAAKGCKTSKDDTLQEAIKEIISAEK